MPEHRRCVVKQLTFATDNSEIYRRVVELFRQEAAVLQKLGKSSDQIPELYAYLVEEGSFYLVQELIEGQTLKEKIEAEGRLSEQTVKDLLISLLPVLEIVHSRNIVHRDIKPENIILRQRDNKPVLIDFGAVKQLVSTIAGRQGDSQQSIIIGTPAFMAPEQGQGYPGCSSDLYSLALTAICLLTGKIVPTDMIDPSTGKIDWLPYAPDVNSDLAEVLNKAISISRSDRYQTAQEMCEALCALSRPIVCGVRLETLPSDSGEKPTVIGSPEQLKVDQESGTTPPDIVVKQEDPAPQTDQTPASKKLNWIVFILTNTLLLGLLILLVWVFNDSLLARFFPCADSWVRVASLAVMLLYLLLGFLAVGITFKLPIINLSSTVLLPPLPKERNKIILPSLAILAVLWVMILPKLVFIKEPKPVIDSLAVRFSDGTTKSYKPGSVIQMQTGSSITATGMISNASNATCSWSANGGSLTGTTECSVTYTLPRGVTQDVLKLEVTSFCGSCQVSEPFHIQR